MKNFNLLLKDVERELLANLLVSLKYGKLTKSEAKKVAGEFVKFEYKAYEELFKKLFSMSNSSKEVRKVYVKYAPKYLEEKDHAELDRVRQNFSDVLKGDEQNGR